MFKKPHICWIKQTVFKKDYQEEGHLGHNQLALADLLVEMRLL